MPITLSTIADLSTPVSTATGALAFTITGIVGTITLAGASYNHASVPDGNIVFGGSGASRTVTVTPTSTAGFATIAITATDDDDDIPVTTTFLLSVTAASPSAWVAPSGWELQQVGPNTSATKDGENRTLVYSAPYPAAESDKPDAGDTVDGQADVIVGTVTVDPVTGDGAGACTVTISLIPQTKGEGITDTDPTPTFTRRYDFIEKPLTTHPIYLPAYGPFPAGSKVLTNEDLAEIESWKNETVSDLKGAYQFKLNGSGITTLSSNAQHAARRILVGEETWQCPVPTVSMVSLVRIRPTASTSMGKGFRGAPPGFPSGSFPLTSSRGILLTWFGISDDATRQGRTGPWQQTISFQGVEFVDPDLYPVT